jgi:hypothetical protein
VSLKDELGEDFIGLSGSKPNPCVPLFFASINGSIGPWFIIPKPYPGVKFHCFWRFSNILLGLG